VEKQSARIRKQKISGLRAGEKLNRVAFPMGGIGAGMLSLEGTGALSQVSLRHKPDVNHEPQVFAALHVKGAKTARVLEGPVPMWKILGTATGYGTVGVRKGKPFVEVASGTIVVKKIEFNG